MIQQLTKYENKVYTELDKEHYDSGFYKITSLDNFIKHKWETEKNHKKAATYYQIWLFACEDYY